MPSKIFFTADLHLGHKNVIKYCNRPFRSVEEMNETLIDNWNNTVSDRDEIYVIGDFAFMGTKQTELVLQCLKGKEVPYPFPSMSAPIATISDRFPMKKLRKSCRRSIGSQGAIMIVKKARHRLPNSEDSICGMGRHTQRSKFHTLSEKSSTVPRLFFLLKFPQR